MQVLKNWTDETSRKFQEEILVFEHNLAETDLFTDEALIWLLDNHPPHLLDVCTMGDPNHPTSPNKMLTGDFRDTDSQTLLAAAKSGRIWINVRKAMNVHPRYNKIFKQMFKELTNAKAKKIIQPKGGILISSPISQTPYHCDKTETLLWHIRGEKRVYVYPNNEAYLPQKAYEAMLDNMIDDDLPYNKTFDDEAEIIDLKPGQAACWSLNAPHRVDNSSFCVSVASEYSTQDSRLKNAAIRTDAYLRRTIGFAPKRYKETGQITRILKGGVALMLKKLGIIGKPVEAIDYVAFKLDACLLYTSPSPRDQRGSRMPSSA